MVDLTDERQSSEGSDIESESDTSTSDSDSESSTDDGEEKKTQALISEGIPRTTSAETTQLTQEEEVITFSDETP